MYMLFECFQVHRNCRHDDAFGVSEALNETAFGKGLVARGSHFLIVGPYINKSLAGNAPKEFLVFLDSDHLCFQESL